MARRLSHEAAIAIQPCAASHTHKISPSSCLMIFSVSDCSLANLNTHAPSQQSSQSNLCSQKLTFSTL